MLDRGAPSVTARPAAERSGERASKIPVAILGGSGYVAGELLRLLSAHPRFELAAIGSTSAAGELVEDSFPHLAGALPDGLRFVSEEEIVPALAEAGERVRSSGEESSNAIDPSRDAAEQPRGSKRGRSGGTDLGGPSSRIESSGLDTTTAAGLFAATPHGATAALVGRALQRAEHTDVPLHVVDLSADFRFPDPLRFASIYGQAHAAPELCPSFTACVPEHTAGAPTPHAAQPGCFTTAAVLPVAPLLAGGMIEGDIFVSAITGSSGSGRTPGARTHHPQRRSGLYAYAPLAHRHEAEMRALLGAFMGGVEPEVAFVPHSGPFVRGIHATIRVGLTSEMIAPEIAAAINAFYESAPFVGARCEPPSLTDVVGTNACRIGVAARGRTAVLTSVIDNLVKGSAGGGVQWMNRLFGLPDDTGLRTAGLGWF